MTEWSSEIIDRLCILWSEGHTTAEIGRRLHISKNAVVGNPTECNSRRALYRSAGIAAHARRGTSEQPARAARHAPAGVLLGTDEAALPIRDVVFAH